MSNFLQFKFLITWTETGPVMWFTLTWGWYSYYLKSFSMCTSSISSSINNNTTKELAQCWHATEICQQQLACTNNIFRDLVYGLTQRPDGHRIDAGLLARVRLKLFVFLSDSVITNFISDVTKSSFGPLPHSDTTTRNKCIRHTSKSHYRQFSNTRQLNCWSLRCSWSIACRRCSNYIFILNLTPGFNGLGKDNYKMRREAFKFWYLVRLILKTLRYVIFCIPRGNRSSLCLRTYVLSGFFPA